MTPVDQNAAALLDALGGAALKATLLLAVGASAVWVLRRRSAALKHAIWTMGLAATMALLVLPAVVPAWRVIPLAALSLTAARTHATAVTAAFVDSKTAPDHPERHDETVGPVGVGLHSSSNDVLTPERGAPASRGTTDHWPSLLAALWLAGATLVLARHALSVVALRRLCRRARPLGDSAGAGLGRRLAADLDIGRRITFLSCDDIELPLTWGIVGPRVVLPADAGDWHEDRLLHVLQHELAHVTRLDAGTQLVASAACAAFWFHPLVWHASRRMRHERERACDDRVLAQGVVPSVYASDLLALVDVYGPTDRHHAALAMARGSTFEGRLLALLDPTIEHSAASLIHLTIVFVLALVVVVPVAALRAAAPLAPTMVVSAATSTLAPPIAVATPASRIDPSSLARMRHASEDVRTADLFDGCLAGGSGAHDHRNAVNGQTIWTASAQIGDCRVELTAHGDITFNPDVTTIQRISDNGDIDITASIHGVSTRLVARESGDDAVSYAFVRNGQPADFDAAGRAWLASLLTALDRHTAFAIGQRLPLLLEAGGAATVLDAIDRLRTEHARMAYLVALSANATLTEGELDRAMAVVMRITRDDARLAVLLALARHNRFEGARLDAYLNAAAALQSVERRRALAAVTHR